LLVKHGKQLVETGFGYNGGEEVREAGTEVCHRGIETMLEVSYKHYSFV
jgi:3-dehydroquinate synthase